MAARIRVPRIVWGAMLASLGAYAAAIVTSVQGAPPGGELLPLPVLIGLAASCAIASFVAPSLVHRQAIARATIAVEELPLNTAPTGYRSTGGRYLRLTPAVYDIALALYFTPLILSLALSEAVAIFGVLAGFSGMPPTHWAPFLGASALLIAVRFPTWRAAIAPIEKHTGAVAPPMT